MDALDCALLLAARGGFEFLDIVSFEISPGLIEADLTSAPSYQHSIKDF